jgi:NADH:ubiquinone oxidoreductase subunit K
MIRSLVARNALSAVLFVVAVIGIVVQLRNVREGLIGPETRLVLVAYSVIALYALASIAVRLRASGKTRN